MERLVYSEGNPPPESPGTICTAEEDKTVKSDGKAADMNWIIKRYESSGVLPESEREGVFMDISEMPSFAAALDQVNKAREYFMSLPPDVRALFNNEPERMLDAWQRGELGEVFERIGLLTAVPAEPEVPLVQARGDDGRFESGKEPATPS